MWWWLAVGNTAGVVVVSSREYCCVWWWLAIGNTAGGGSMQEGWDRSSGLCRVR